MRAAPILFVASPTRTQAWTQLEVVLDERSSGGTWNAFVDNVTIDYTK